MFGQEALALAFANATNDYLVVFDENGGLRYANPAFVRSVLGNYPVNGQNLFSLMDPGSAERARKAIAGLAEGPRQVELNHTGKDGKPKPVHYDLCQVEGGVAAIGRDKTADLALLGEIVQLNMQLEEKQTELSDANARLERLAVTDQATGLYNRHHFFAVVEHLFAEARRYELPLCCMMIDADYFKQINDDHGHMFGDHVLKVLSDRMRRNIRRSDVLARYGGEEFALVAPNTDLNTGVTLAERLRAAAEQEPVTLGKTSATVTISLGLASSEVMTTGTFDDLLNSADQALYAAKEKGRNRAVVWLQSAAAKS